MAASATEAYRERLNGQLGRGRRRGLRGRRRALVADGRADAHRLVITGGSAGGYTTLCALTFHEVFRAGASHYGVSDLEALTKETHKFESRYLDRLVGPWPEAAALYRARSPIPHVERLSCPIIFFQGLEDAVVPPNQTELMIEALRRKRPAGRVPHLRRRAARLSQGRDHPDPCCAPSSRSTDASSAWRRPTASRI